MAAGSSSLRSFAVAHRRADIEVIAVPVLRLRELDGFLQVKNGKGFSRVEVPIRSTERDLDPGIRIRLYERRREERVEVRADVGLIGGQRLGPRNNRYIRRSDSRRPRVRIVGMIGMI